jgi:hypothetical protein
MIDSQRLVYLPAWARWVSLAILLSGLVISSVVAISFVGEPDRADWILLAMSVSQVSLTALVVLFVVLFSEKDASIETLDRKSDQFVQQYLPRYLGRLSLEDGTDGEVQVFDAMGGRDIFGRVLQLSFGEEVKLRIWAGLNVRRIFVIYFLRTRGEDPQDVEALKEIFAFTFGGAEPLGYKVNYEKSQVDGERFVSIWTTVEAEEDLLVSPKEKLFWAQDIAMMTQSFLRTAIRNGDKVDFDLPFDPRPL